MGQSNHNNKRLNTKITNLGRYPFEHLGVVNPPVYHASTILFPTYEDYLQGRVKYAEGDTNSKAYPHSTYGRYGTSSTQDFEQALAEISGADHAMLCSSGAAAIAVSLLSFVKCGDHVLMVDSCYDPARRFCEQELKRFGVEITYYQPLLGKEIETLIQPNTKIIYAESPGSLTFEVQDIPLMASIAHKHNALLVLDNTYAAPALNRPFELGADVVLYSASKYVSGHSDLIMGVVLTNKATKSAVTKTHHNLGCCPGPDDVYLAQRGLRTLQARMAVHQKAALEMAEFLSGMPEVVRVLHPALPSCPGHAQFMRDFSGSNGLFSVILKPHSQKALAAMFNGMELFGMGYSWGGFESLMIPCNLRLIRSHPSVPEDHHLIRLHIGLEDLEDLKADLKAGFERLREAA